MHLNYLDGTRALAALYVLIHHILMQLVYDESVYFEFINSIFQYGRFAVDVFIVLSGFCLMIPLVENIHIASTSSFIKRRAIRILPAYYGAMILSLILIYTVIGTETGSHWDASIPVTAWDIITHIVLIQDLFGETAYKINHTFWSISVECRIYLLFPLLVRLSRKHGIFTITITSILISFILWHGYSYIGLNSYTMSPHYLSLFMFGMLACYISLSKQSYYVKFKQLYLKIITLLLITFLIVTIIIIPIFYHTLTFSTLTSDYIVGICTSIFLLSISSGEMKLFAKALSWQPLAFLGTFAYSIYLIHAPILEILSRYFVLPLDLSHDLNLALMISSGTIASLGIAYLFFLIAERPYLRKKKLIDNIARPEIALQ